MRRIRRLALLAAVLTGLTARAEEPCKPEARRHLPAAEDFARLCPKDRVFAKAPEEKSAPGGCDLYFREADGLVQVTAAKQQPRVSGGAKVGAQKAAEIFGKMEGGKAPAVKRMPWKSVEAWTLEDVPGYYVDSAGEVLVVQVTPAGVKPPSDACAEAIVGDIVKRFGGR